MRSHPAGDRVPRFGAQGQENVNLDMYRKFAGSGSRLVLVAFLLASLMVTLPSPVAAQGATATTEVNVDVAAEAGEAAPVPTPTPTATIPPPPPPTEIPATIPPLPTEVPPILAPEPTEIPETLPPVPTEIPATIAPTPTEILPAETQVPADPSPTATFAAGALDESDTQVEPTGTSTSPAMGLDGPDTATTPTETAGLTPTVTPVVTATSDATATVSTGGTPATTETEPLATTDPTMPATADVVPTATSLPLVITTPLALASPQAAASPAPGSSGVATPGLAQAMTYQLQPDITCRPATSDQQTRVFTCVIAGAVQVANGVIPGIDLEWLVSASTDPGWSVELSGEPGVWAGASSSLLSDQTVVPGPDAGGDVQVALTVHVRIQPTTCGVLPEATIRLDATLDAGIPGNNPASLTSGANRASGSIAVQADASSEPGLAFSGPLTFDAVNPERVDEDTSTTGSISLVASNLTAACGEWIVTMVGAPLTATNGDTIPATNLQLVSINGQPVPDGACSLESSCALGTVQTGPSENDTQVFELEFSLVVPAGTLAGSFGASISASIDPAIP